MVSKLTLAQPSPRHRDAGYIRAPSQGPRHTSWSSKGEYYWRYHGLPTERDTYRRPSTTSPSVSSEIHGLYIICPISIWLTLAQVVGCFDYLAHFVDLGRDLRPWNVTSRHLELYQRSVVPH